jgi:hypothetical protein
LAFFDQAPCLYEFRRLDAKLLGDRKQIGLVGFEEAQQSGEQRRVAEPAPELLGPDSGQVEEALRPTLGAERCGKRSEGERDRIIWYPGCHGLQLCVMG